MERTLDARGIVLRRYDSVPMHGWLRVTAPPAAETDRLIEVLGEIGLGTELAHGGAP